MFFSIVKNYNKDKGLLMSKKTIRNAALMSLGTLILSLVLFGVSSANTSITEVGSTSNFLGSVSFFAAILCILVCAVTGAISYFGTLIKVTQLRRRKWFVGVLLTGVTGALIFGLVGPEKKITEGSLAGFLYDSYKQTKRTLT